MPRKRKLDATLPDQEAEEGGPAAGGIGGFWGGSATNMLQARLREVQQSQVDSILHGVTAIDIHPDMVDDHVGTDRIGDWNDDEAFAALVADMRRRGQRQPVRVRPADPNWSPEPQPPHAGSARFILQSGRRRLAAARELGLPVRAVISTDIGDEKLADLEERFLENTMRQDLSGFEELLSVGLIAQAHTDLTQTEIAQRLGVAQGDISLGLACIELHDRIVETVDIRTTPKRKFRELIPQLRGEARNAPAKEKPAGQAAKRPVVQIGKVKVETQPKKDGLKISLSGRAFSERELERINKALLDTLARFGH